MQLKISEKEISMALEALHNAAGYPMLPDNQIETETGFIREEMHVLFGKMVRKKEYLFTNHEREMVIKCLGVCLKYIDAWEFPATFDHEKEEVQKFYDQLSKK